MNKRKTFIIVASCIFNLILFTDKTLCADQKYEECLPKHFCGGHEIKFPFYIRESQPSHCGFPGFNLTCRKVGEYSYPILHIPDNDYVIESFSYENHTLLVYNAAVLTSNMRCLPRIQNWTLKSDQFMFVSSVSNLNLFTNCSIQQVPTELSKHRVNYCDNGDRAGWGLAMWSNDENLHSALEDCKVNVKAPVDVHGEHRENTTGDYGELLRRGFFLNWTATNCSECERTGGICGFDLDKYQFQCSCPDRPHFRRCRPVDPAPENKRSSKLKIILGTATAVAGLAVLIILVICIKGKVFSRLFLNTKNYQYIEAFLKSCGSLAPKRYTYSDVKRMTDSFKVKLGQGGYGCVYKGNLHDGRAVAVKVLKESKGSGEEFINEVASISRTSHINIVSLLGFCFEGCRRALIYEFMHNGSLEKFIYNKTNPLDHCLEWKRLHQIAIGIARGLEYLHRGCNTRIVHFDIKPHNILLDEDFCPKITDFGLAKLCPQKESILSMVHARGTIGYIAPEVIHRNFGGVSHKSDVYSYGMMILEMVGEKQNNKAENNCSSEMYFPDWIYDQLELCEHGNMLEEEHNIVRKMIIVSLWCIQTHPSCRPSISRVVEMLEGSLESLQVPPKPTLSSPERSLAESSFIEIS